MAFQETLNPVAFVARQPLRYLAARRLEPSRNRHERTSLVRAPISRPLSKARLSLKQAEFSLLSLSSCPGEWMSKRYERYGVRPRIGSKKRNFCLSTDSNKSGPRN